MSVDSSGEENSDKVQYTIQVPSVHSIVFCYNFSQEQPVENIKLQFILLKHSKDLAPEYKHVVTRVKSIWENLEHVINS